MSWKDNYVSFDDTDISTDYFHGYGLGVNQTVAWVKDKGSRSISVTVTNDDPKTPALRRVQQIARDCGYTIEDKSHMHTFHGYRDEEVKRFVYEWLLTATPERLKVLDTEDAEDERKRLEAEAHAKTPEARRARILAEMNQVRNVTAVFDERGFHQVTEEERTKQIRELEEELKAIQ